LTFTHGTPKQIYNINPKGYKDLRELFDDKDIDTARKYKRLVQADLDTRSNPSMAAAIDYMQKNLGKVLYVRIINYKRRLLQLGKRNRQGIQNGILRQDGYSQVEIHGL
jgi:predicted dehydrogenase